MIFLKFYISEPTRKPSAELKSSHKLEDDCSIEVVRSSAAYWWEESLAPVGLLKAQNMLWYKFIAAH